MIDNKRKYFITSFVIAALGVSYLLNRKHSARDLIR